MSELDVINNRVASLKNSELLQFRASSDIIAMLLLKELERVNKTLDELNKKTKKEALL